MYPDLKTLDLSIFDHLVPRCTSVDPAGKTGVALDSLKQIFSV